MSPFPRADETDQWLKLGRAAKELPPRHVLVCAPSNAAIDEIVTRLLQRGGDGASMLNADGVPFIPSVVRVGPNVKETLVDVSLDALAKKRQTESGESLSYEAARLAVLNEAQIVCTTLSCAGYSMFTQLRQGFDTVLIDEAAQAVEASTLIPLKYACRRLIMVGDPQQLPATVFSDHAMQHNYEQSLFLRLQRGGQQVALLTTQYRMRPSISFFPATHFYSGALDDAPHLRAAPPCPWHHRRCLGPYMFYDVAEGRSEEVNSSWANVMEAQLALRIVRLLLSSYAEHLSAADIGVISPYNAQVRLVRRLFLEAFGDEVAPLLEVNSVDGFQGREKRVIIFSTVRSEHRRDEYRGIGFVKDVRRINVSMTRAKHSLLILGHAQTLKRVKIWGALVKDAKQRKCFITAHSPIGIWFESAAKEMAAQPEALEEASAGDGLAASADGDPPGSDAAAAEVAGRGGEQQAGPKKAAPAAAKRKRRRA